MEICYLWCYSVCFSPDTGCVPTASRYAGAMGEFVPSAIPSVLQNPELKLPEFAVGFCRAVLPAQSQPLERKGCVKLPCA